MLKIISILLIALSVISCSKKDKLNYTKSTVNGVEIITNENRPADQKFDLGLKLTAEINSDYINGDSLTSFREILNCGVDVDQKGNYFVLDYKDCKVLKYDKNGKYLKTFGRYGQGPGEFSDGTFVIYGDTIFISNSGNRSVLRYNTNGNYLFCKTYNEDQIQPNFYNGFNKYYIASSMNISMESDKIMSCKETIRIYSVKNGFINQLIETTKDSKTRIHTPCAISDEGICYITVPSSDKYKIDVFDTAKVKKQIINKNHIKAKTTLKIDEKESIVSLDAITELKIDKRQRLWVQTSKDRGKNRYDIFAQGIYQNTVSLPLDSTYTVFFRKDKLIAYKDDYTNIKIYDYK